MKLIEGQFTIEWDKFEVGKYVYSLKKPLQFAIILGKDGIYSAVLNFGDIEKYKNIEIKSNTYDQLCRDISETLCTLYNESKDAENDSEQDKWFLENVTVSKLELRGKKDV
jgi:hypothetical protein